MSDQSAEVRARELCNQIEKAIKEDDASSALELAGQLRILTPNLDKAICDRNPGCTEMADALANQLRSGNRTGAEAALLLLQTILEPASASVSSRFYRSSASMRPRMPSRGS
jgi:hypothetical protein